MDSGQNKLLGFYFQISKRFHGSEYELGCGSSMNDAPNILYQKYYSKKDISNYRGHLIA